MERTGGKMKKIGQVFVVQREDKRKSTFYWRGKPITDPQTEVNWRNPRVALPTLHPDPRKAAKFFHHQAIRASVELNCIATMISEGHYGDIMALVPPNWLVVPYQKALDDFEVEKMASKLANPGEIEVEAW